MRNLRFIWLLQVPRESMFAELLVRCCSTWWYQRHTINRIYFPWRSLISSSAGPAKAPYRILVAKKWRYCAVFSSIDPKTTLVSRNTLTVSFGKQSDVLKTDRMWKFDLSIQDRCEVHSASGEFALPARRAACEEWQTSAALTSPGLG